MTPSPALRELVQKKHVKNVHFLAMAESFVTKGKPERLGHGISLNY